MNRRNCISRHGNCNRPASNFRKTRHSRQSHFVGYNTIAVPADRLFGYGVQFTEVSGIEEIAVTDLLSVNDPKGSGTFSDAADQIWLWDTVGMNWKRYFYRSARSGVKGWCLEGTAELTTDKMKNGDGFFFRRSSAGDGLVTISGALKATNADPISMTADRLHFICNPWPVEVAITSFESMINDPKGSGTFSDAADQIWYWDTTAMNWVRYFYRSARSGVKGWCAEGTAELTEAKIGVGQGFFFRRSSAAAGTLTWVKPTGL